MMHRSIHRYRRKKQKKLIIIGSISLSLFLCVGYAAFSTNLKVMTRANIKDRHNLYVASFGSDTKGNGTKEKPYETIEKAYDSAWQNSTIYVMDNIVQKSKVIMDDNKDILLTSYSEESSINSIIRDNNYTNYLIEQINGNLTLKNITVDGKNIVSETSLISATGLTLETGTTIKNGINNTYLSGAIQIKIGGNLKIEGGAVTNNQGIYGGAIHASNNSLITLVNGEITKNKSTNAGGAIYTNGNALIVGGEISDNYTIGDNNGGAIAMISPSDADADTTIIIEGGIISNNSALQGGAIILYTNSQQYHSILKINDGHISNNQSELAGGGIYIHTESEIIVSNGIISNNKAGTVGGGIRVNGGLLTVEGGTIMSNQAQNDGGISIDSNSTYTYKSGVVCGNTPANKYETSATCPN